MNSDKHKMITDQTHAAALAIRAEQEEIRQRGYEVGVDSKALTPDPAQLEALEESARSRLRTHNVEIYDPVKNPDDKAREEKFTKLKMEGEQKEQALQHSHAKVRDCGERVAESKPGEKPGLGWVYGGITFIAALALSGTLVPTVVDSLATASALAEETIRMIGGAFGLIYGLFVSVTIVLTYKLGRSRTFVGLSGLVGGLVIALGFLIFRCHLAESMHDYLVAGGLAVIETGLILTLEWIGIHQRHIYDEWLAKDQEHRRALAQLETAQTEETRRQEVVDHNKAEQESHIAYLEERSIRRLRAPELEDAAICASRQGYLAGIESNRGTIQAA